MIKINYEVLNKGTDNEWYQWNDEFGNCYQQDKDGAVTMLPEEKNMYSVVTGIRCYCPHCGEYVEVEVDGAIGGINDDYVECPECEKVFAVSHEY